MKTLVVFSSVLMLTAAVYAQSMGQRQQFYNARTITTIVGTIASVDSVAAPRGNNYSIRLTVKDTSGTVSVIVGPSFFLDHLNISFMKDSSVEVTGSKVHFNDNDFIIAAQIKTGGKTIKLRDDSGMPLWSRRGMR